MINAGQLPLAPRQSSWGKRRAANWRACSDFLERRFFPPSPRLGP